MPIRHQPVPPQQHPYPDVNPLWLVKALATAIVAALLCAWLAVCLLVYQGAWQLVLHPTAQLTAAPAVPFDTIQFDAGPTGTPRLTAWYIPSGTTTAPTVLYLHGGTGNLSNSAQTLTQLHNLNLNLFAIDYRGFGQSDPQHPNQPRMLEDAQSALDYLLNTRHLPPAHIIPMGSGLGCYLAAQLAITHPDLPTLILQDPDPNLARRALTDRRTTFVPASLLFHDRFDIAAITSQLHQPKLLLITAPTDPTWLKSVPDPKFIATLTPNTPAYTQTISRFLDQYLSAK